MLGTGTGSAFDLTLFGHAMTVWENIAVLAAFGFIMNMLAVWSFGRQE